MKNLFFLSVIALIFSVSACKNADDKAKNAIDKTEEVAKDAVDATKSAAQKVADKAGDMKNAALDALNIPNFENKEVSNYLSEYAAFVKEYGKKMANKADLNEMDLKNLKDKASEFTQRSGDVVSKLKSDEVQNFNDAFKAIQKEWNKINNM